MALLLDALHTAKDLGRLQQIATVLLRHGLVDVVRRLGIAPLLQRAGKALHWPAAQRLADTSTPAHVRAALEELGPTFVKVGQMLAGRTDLLPPAWTLELSKLHEHAAPVPADALRAQLTEDLGAPPEEAFAQFAAEPVAAASIAQVHRATLHDGTAVAVKVRRPGIRETVDADLRLLARLADVAARDWPELRRWQPRRLVQELGRSLRAELDLRLEAQHAVRLARALRVKPQLVVPRVHAAFTRERLLVLDWLEGPSVATWLASGVATPAARQRLAQLGADAVLHLVFEARVFHADPHPGNLLVLQDGRLGVLDFGMVGALTDSRRAEVLELMLGAVRGVEEQVVDVLLDWAQDDQLDTSAMAQDCAQLLERWREVPVRDLDVAALLHDLMALLRNHDLVLPADIAMLLKVLLTLDSLGRALDPSFVTAAFLEPYARRAVRLRRSPIAQLRAGHRALRDLTIALPRHARRVLRQVRRGRVQVAVDLQQIDGAAQRLERAANRATIGMVTAALIVGTAIALNASAGPIALGLPAFGVLGFSSSIVGGLWLVRSIARSGRQ